MSTTVLHTRDHHTELLDMCADDSAQALRTVLYSLDRRLRDVYSVWRSQTTHDTYLPLVTDWLSYRYHEEDEE